MFHLLAYFGAFFGIGLAGWIGRTFGEPSIDQILYHLHYSEGAALEMGRIFVFTFVVEVLVFPFVFAVAAALLHHAAARAWPSWRRHVLRAAPHVALVAGVMSLLLQFSVFSFAATRLGEDRFAQAYVDPAKVPLKDRSCET